MKTYLLLASQLNQLIAWAGGGGSSSDGGGSFSGGGGFTDTSNGTGSGDTALSAIDGGFALISISLFGVLFLAILSTVLGHTKFKRYIRLVVWILIAPSVLFMLYIGVFVSWGGYVSAIILVLYVLYGMIVSASEKYAKAQEDKLKTAGQNDPVWNKDSIITTAKDIFLRYQSDWSNYGVDSMKSYMTERYYNHAKLMVMALKQVNRQDNVKNPEINSVDIVDFDDNTDNSKDTVYISFSAFGNDKLLDTKTNKVLFSDTGEILEVWKFNRDGNKWLLDGIQPSTEEEWTRNEGLESFASQQGFYYSLDWGHLLLPVKGQIFSEGKFGVSDINNHVIGLYKNIIVQLYTYTPRPASYDSETKISTKSKVYLIAQTSLPKDYEDIVVRRNKLMQLGIKGLQKVTMEWGQFNSKYEVYSTSLEQVTSFELLNPLYMQKLQAVDFEVNMEVVNNDLYLYTPIKNDNASDNLAKYETMLSLVKDAFEQMKM